MLIIPNYADNPTYDLKVIELIIRHIDKFNTIICYKKFDSDNYDLLHEKCKHVNCEIIDNVTPRDLDVFLLGDTKDFNLKKYEEFSSAVQAITTPIIAVAGIGEKTDKFEVSLVLRDIFIKAGYKVSQIGSKNYCELLDFHSFPSFLFNPQIDERLKIICFNKYIKQIEIEECPDIIIITIPGAMKAFSENITQGFGLLHYMVFQAVLVDYLIVCSYLGTDFSNSLSRESEICKNRYGCNIDCCHISNTIIDYNATRYMGRIITNLLPRTYVDKAVLDSNTYADSIVVDILNDNSREKLYHDILKKLNSDYSIV